MTYFVSIYLFKTIDKMVLCFYEHLSDIFIKRRDLIQIVIYNEYNISI